MTSSALTYDDNTMLALPSDFVTSWDRRSGSGGLLVTIFHMRKKKIISLTSERVSKVRILGLPKRSVNIDSTKIFSSSLLKDLVTMMLPFSPECLNQSSHIDSMNKGMGGNG